MIKTTKSDLRPKKSRGRPKTWSSSSKLDEILELFPKDGSRIRAKELKEKALDQGISPNTFYSYLRTLEDFSQTIKETIPAAKRAEIYYKLITKDKLFGVKETLEEIYPYFERIMTVKIPVELKNPILQSVLEMNLALLLAYLLKIGKKARTIEDPQKRKEFINITLQIHLHPLLLMLSSLPEIDPKHWENAFVTVDGMRHTSRETFINEVTRILPDHLSTLLLDLYDDFRQGRMKTFEKKWKEFAKLSSELKQK
jgi:hypothetical protein